jgi:hypothetical protein
MAGAMNDSLVPAADAVPIEDVLRHELAHGDAMVGTIAPILRHLLANDDHSVFGDEIIARVRGMLAHVAAQLLDAVASVHGSTERVEHDPDQISALSDSFVAHGGFLAHVHGLALEWQLTERLHGRLGLDPVLSPLLQALISSSESATAGRAMALLAAKAKFAQCQRRMQLPLTELPGDLLHAALLALRNHAGAASEAEIEAADRMLRGNHDESRSRLGLIARLVTGMGGGATAALSISHAGTAMFLSALALASGQDRDLAILATNEGQLARFALAMRAAGLRTPAIAEQFVALHPSVDLPEGFEELGADHAAAMLARSAVQPGV